MSTFSQDLDFFDESVFDPLGGLRKAAESAGSIESNEENSEEEEGMMTGKENEDESDDSKDAAEIIIKCLEEQGEGDLLENCEKEIPSRQQKVDKSSERFSTELWSEAESTRTGSSDSWDFRLSGAIPWDDEKKPYEHLLNYADLDLTPEEESGLLTDRIVAACSSYLTESPDNKCHVVAKVSLNNKNLNDIRILGYHRFLQYVDLSWNNLEDLTPLGCIPYLMYLDVSHNLLAEVLRFQPPLNLTYVNYSYNEVWQIDNLSDFWTLCYLDLSHNKISKIQGLHGLRYLRHLDLSHNKIERLENLNNLKVTDLNLECNLISKFETEQGLGLGTMPHLTNLHLGSNSITTLAFLKDAYHLKKLELQGNHISDLAELDEMKYLRNLRHLDVSENPVSQRAPYRSFLIASLPELKVLDGKDVDVSERVAACKRHDLEIQLEAARNNVGLILLEQLNDCALELEDVLPVDQASYPFVILVGPSASSKKKIMSCLAKKFPDKIHIGKLHTTRKVLDGEKHLFEAAASRENFFDMTKAGKFLCVSDNLGHLYGLSKKELETAVKHQKLCLTSMDMVSALTVHRYGIRPFLILTLPQSKEEHSKRLKMTYGPVVCRLGAAYLAQRQTVDTHESNVARIKAILDGLVKRVARKSSHEKIECDECLRESSQCSDSVSDSRISTTSKSLMESSPNPTVHCNSSRETFPCSPGKCGYQACMSAAPPEYESASEISYDSQSGRIRAFFSEEENDKYSTTSYSAEIPAVSPVKMEKFFSETEFSFGEHDPFSDWSMPFVDWSEINLTEMQLEEAAEILCQKYIENVMSSRDVYQNLHLNNPGLFSLCVNTDSMSEAVKTITKFLKEVWRSTPFRKPAFDVKDDLLYRAFVPKKLEQMKEILNNDFLSSGDGTGNGLTETAAAIDSPSAVRREMRLKGFGDSSIFNDETKFPL